MTNSTQTLMSARDYAQAYVGTKSAQKRKEILALVQAKTQASKRVRWVHLAKAMADGDLQRVSAYAAEGEAKREAWAAVRASAPAKPKASTAKKPTNASKAARKPAPAKPEASVADPLTAFAQMLAHDEAAMVAFFNRVAAFKAK